MTPRERYRSHALLMYSAVAAGVAMVVAGAAVRLTASSLGGAIGIFLATWAAVSIASLWPGAWVYEAAGRRFDRKQELPPTGGDNDGHDRPQPGRLTP